MTATASTRATTTPMVAPTLDIKKLLSSLAVAPGVGLPAERVVALGGP